MPSTLLTLVHLVVLGSALAPSPSDASAAPASSVAAPQLEETPQPQDRRDTPTASPPVAVSATPTMALLPMSGATVDDATRATLDGLLLNRLSDVDGLSVVSPKEVEALLGLERMKDALGCDDVSCAAELAGALGSRYLLAAFVTRLDNDLQLNASVIDNQAGQVLARGTVTCRVEPGEYPPAVNALVVQLLDPLLGAAARVGDQRKVLPLALRCLRGEADPCVSLQSKGLDAYSLAHEACVGGDEPACKHLALTSDNRGPLMLIAACESGVGNTCKIVVAADRQWENGAGLRLAGKVTLATAGATAALATVFGIVSATMAEPQASLWSQPNKTKEGLAIASGVLAGSTAVLAGTGLWLWLWGRSEATDIEDRARHATVERGLVFVQPTVLEQGFGLAVTGCY
jgi:TolB-like protein